SATTTLDGAQAVQIKERRPHGPATSQHAGRERTDVRDRPSSGADADLDGNERRHTDTSWALRRFTGHPPAPQCSSNSPGNAWYADITNQVAVSPRGQKHLPFMLSQMS